MSKSSGNFPPPRWANLQEEARYWRRLRYFGIVTLLVMACFCRPLRDLAGFAYGSDLYSHILLIPFISLYLIWASRQSLAPDERPGLIAAAFLFAVSLTMLCGYGIALQSGWRPENRLALLTAAFLCLWLAGAWVCLGTGFMRRYLFAVSLLVFVIPFPEIVRQAVERFLQSGSAQISHFFLWASGMPLVRQADFVFQMPGKAIEVAPVCSGIHSSLVLFITSLIAGHLLLRRASTRWLLALAVIALGLLRNGLRVFVICQLCVQVDPGMIGEDIHTHGGPIFFGLSLIPFFLLVLLLRQREAGEMAMQKPAGLSAV